MPMDDDEMDRMDLQHRKYELVIGDKHFLAPIGPNPQRILDLGTGTGEIASNRRFEYAINAQP